MLYNLNFYNVIYQIYFYLKKIKNFSSTKDSIKSKKTNPGLGEDICNIAVKGINRGKGCQPQLGCQYLVMWVMQIKTMMRYCYTSPKMTKI